VVGRPGSIGGGGSLVSGLVLGVLGNTLVAHISIVAGLVISNSVGDNLGPAVGKGNTVRSTGGVSVALLVLGKVDMGVVIGNSIAVGVGSGLVVLRLGLVVDGPWGIRWGRSSMVGEGNSHKGSNGDEELKQKNIS
jgi:hypothetical protein